MNIEEDIVRPAVLGLVIIAIVGIYLVGHRFDVIERRLDKIEQEKKP